MYEELLIRFWHTLTADLHHKGIVSKDAPTGVLYGDHAIIERKILAIEAQKFMDSDDFTYWADLTGLDKDRLREAIYAGTVDSGRL